MIDFDKIFDNGFENQVIDRGEISNKTSGCRDLILEKFGKIQFIEEGHHYYIGEDEYTPVSDIIDKYVPYVDWDEKAANYARKYGRAKEDVQKEWRLNNLKSTISGTRTHEFGESYTNLMCGRVDGIREQNRPQYVQEYNTLIPTYPKEDAVKKFYDELEPNLHPVGAEFRLSSEYMDCLKICGTCDLLFYDSDDDSYVIGDWKTNKSLVKEYNRDHRVMLLPPVNNLYEEPLSHYRLQFNIYQRMLESIGLKISDRILIWLKDDGTYEKIHIDKIADKVIEKIMKGAK